MKTYHRALDKPGTRLFLMLLVALAAGLVLTLRAPGHASADAATNGSFSFALANSSVTEGQTACITINRAQGLTGDQTVQYTLAFGGAATSADLNGWGPASGNITFFAGVSSRTLDATTPGGCIPTFDDGIANAARTVTFTLSLVSGGGVLGAPTQHVLTLVDNEGPPVFSFATTAYSVVEGTATVTLTVNRAGSVGSAFTVQYATSDGTASSAGASDFTAIGLTTLTFGVGVTTQTFNVSITNDGTAESPENFTVTLSNQSSGTISNGTATVTINDDDGAGVFQYTSSTFSVTEGGGNATLSISRTSGSTGSVTVRCTATGGSATGGGTDYTSTDVDVVFNTGVTSGSCSIPITDDVSAEVTETVTYSLTITVNPGTASIGAQNTNTLSIFDNDGASTFAFSSSSYSVGETAGSVLITVSRTGNTTGGASVNFATSDGTAVAGVDYTATSGTLNFAGGETSKTFSVTIINDLFVDPSDTINLTLSSPSVGSNLGSPSTAVLTIIDDESPFGLSVTSVSPAAGPPAGGTTVVITGTGFSGVTAVKFGLVNATSYVVNSVNQITAVSPAGIIGTTVAVQVTTGVGTSADTVYDDFSYTTGPTITSLSPATGPAGVTTFVTITGTGFTPATYVWFGSINATANYVSATQMVAATPTTIGAGIVQVTVTNAAGTSPTSTATQFTFTGTLNAPVVTGLSPASTPINTSGTSVTITGTNFASPATVTFGSVSATNVVVVNSSTITATAPARSSAGVVDVVVTTSVGSSSVSGTGNDFSYTGGTTTYTLYFRWTLVVWEGLNNKSISQAISGTESPDNAATNNVSGSVTAVFKWSPAGVGCSAGQSQCWLAYFPSGVDIPGANDITTLEHGVAYWVAITGPGNATWTVLTGP